jgi:hypothetical protein
MAQSFIQANPWVPGVAAAVVLFLLTWLINFILRQRDRASKTFDYRVIADTPIFNSSARPANLRVTYQGVEVSNPRVTLIKFKNTGNNEIAAEDFEDAYTIQRGAAGILDHSVLESSARSIQLAEITEIGVGIPEYIKVRPRTLNRGDWFTVQLVYDGGEDEPVEILGRVKGETRATSIYPSSYELSLINESRNEGILLAGFVVSMTVFAYIIADMATVALLIGLAAGVVAAAVGYWISFRRKRKLYEQLRAGKQWLFHGD